MNKDKKVRSPKYEELLAKALKLPRAEKLKLIEWLMQNQNSK